MTVTISVDRPPRPAVADVVYDAFVIHAAADEWFVQGYLLAEAGLVPERVLVLTRLGLGEVVIAEIERGIRSSRATIVVLSSAYMDDHWAEFGEQIALHASIAGQRRGVVIPVVLEDCEMPARIQSLVKLDFRDPAPEAWHAAMGRLREYLDRPTVAEPHLPCPYPGMRPFAESDVSRFFGRDVEIERMIRWLSRGRRETLVIGPSGSGKSSLIAAGLVPRLARGVAGLRACRVRTVRPIDLHVEIDALLDDLATPPDTACGLAQAPGKALVVVVDQLEEIFALASRDQRSDFFVAVRRLRACQSCVLVFGLRADYYGEFMSCPLWDGLAGAEARIELAPMHSEKLRIAIECPARDLGVYLQPELVSRILEDVAREPGALPLLQETLLQLWSKRRGRLLALADYRALGDGTRSGLAFAVAEHADDALGALTVSQRAIAFRILIRLVNFGEGRDDTRRQQPRDELRSVGEVSDDFVRVLESLSDQRLITITRDDRNGGVRVDLAHEVLIQAWSTLSGWIQTWRVHEQRRRAFEAAATAWRKRGSGKGGLLDTVELAEAVAWREQAGYELGCTSDLAEFLDASESAQAHSAQQQVRQQADRKRQLVESSRFHQETGWQRLQFERPLEALPYFVAAREIIEADGQFPSSSLRMLFADASRNLPVASLQHQGAVMSAAFSPDGCRVATASADKTARIWDARSGAPGSNPMVHCDLVSSVAFSVDGRRVVTTSRDGTAQVWEVASGQRLGSPLSHGAAVVGAAFSPDSKWLITACADGSARIWAWDEPEQFLVTPLQHRNAVCTVAFASDNKRVVTASADHTARVWDAVSGRPISPPFKHKDRVMSAAFDANAGLVVTASADGTSRIWDAFSATPVSPALVHGECVMSAVFSTDGTSVVTASADHTARVWHVPSGEPLSPPLRHGDVVASATFSRGGTRVCTASRDHTARIWTASGTPLSAPLVHEGPVLGAAFSADGTRVLTASADGTARVWDATQERGSHARAQREHSVRRRQSSGTRPMWTRNEPSPKPVATGDGGAGGTKAVSSLATCDDASVAAVRADQVARSRFAGRFYVSLARHLDTVVYVEFSPDGACVVTASDDGTARIWNAASGELIGEPLTHLGAVVCVGFSPDGTLVVTASRDHSARVWNSRSGRPVSPPLTHQDAVVSAMFSPDGTRVVTASSDHTARVWDSVSGMPRSPALVHQGFVECASFSRDGARVVTGSWDYAARIWDAVTGEPLSCALVHEGTVTTAVFSPDGANVVTASTDRTARIWSVAPGNPCCVTVSHKGTIYSVAYSSDGARIVTASDDRTARVWDAASGQPLSPPLLHDGAVMTAAFDADGARVVTASWDHTARVWDTASGKALSLPLRHSNIVNCASFSLDGAHVVTASNDRSARVWHLPLASGTLQQWRAIVERSCPYELVNGVLSLRATPEPLEPRHHTTLPSAARRKRHS